MMFLIDAVDCANPMASSSYHDIFLQNFSALYVVYDKK